LTSGRPSSLMGWWDGGRVSMGFDRMWMGNGMVMRVVNVTVAGLLLRSLMMMR
jgi:hypothetical protein